jgi:hypothetical protein
MHEARENIYSYTTQSSGSDWREGVKEKQGQGKLGLSPHLLKN